MEAFLEYILAGLLGALLGMVELITRYKDHPMRALISVPSGAHLLVNAAASLLALFFLREIFHVTFGLLPTDPDSALKVPAYQVLAAGIGAMSFFRTSLFVAKVGDKDIPVGPGIIMQALLDVTDRAIDRSRARPRALTVTDIMKGVDFAKAQASLPTYCFTLMQNVSQEEQAAVGTQIGKLSSSTIIDPSQKTLILGLYLMNIVGDEVLKAAVDTLGTSIK